MPMKLLLRENVKGLGDMGEVVNVADGYGRNYLLPRNLAVQPSDANLLAIEAEKKRRAASEAARVEEMKSVAERIAGIDITLKERVASEDKLYGAVSAKEIVAALADEDIQIDAEMIHLDEPIKTLGVHRVPVRLATGVEAELKVWVVELRDLEPKAE